MMLILRRYASSDFHAVWALHQLASQISGVPTRASYFSDLPHIESIFLNSGGEFVVGEYDGQVVATNLVRASFSPVASEADLR
jgi:hypothetical protein